jgi:hypothetical protein
MILRSLLNITALMLIGIIPLAEQAQAQRPNIDAFIQQWDVDHDGTLSLDEIKKAAVARFEALDRGHKGTLRRTQLVP